MVRDCDTCHKNKTEEEFGCPYKGLENNRFYDFPLYGDSKFGIFGCPIYYKNEDNIILKIYNSIENGYINKNTLIFKYRIIHSTIKSWLELYDINEKKKVNDEI